MARLPVVGSDSNTWGTILNQFLQVAHNAGGTLSSVFFVTNVKDDVYGAKGDGSTDDTIAIQAAITAVQNAGGGVVFFPVGTYIISSTLNVTADKVCLLGVGYGSALQTKSTFTATPMIWVQGPGGAQYRFGFQINNLRLVNTVGSTSATGIQLDSTYYAVIANVWVQGIYAKNIFLNGTNTAYGAYTLIDHCQLGPIPGGAVSGGLGITTSFHEFSTIRACTIGFFSNSGGIGIDLQNSNYMIENTSIDDCDTAIRLFFCRQAHIVACNFDRGWTHFIYNQGSAGALVVANSFGSFVGTAPKSIIDRSTDVSANSSIFAFNSVVVSSGWTNFLNELTTTAPGDLYIGNEIQNLGVIRTQSVIRINSNNNPVGHSVTQPAVPATTVALTNNTGYDCQVFITGGTVSAIAIGGTATGVTLATGAVAQFRVPMAQTITLTYTVAPTWSWYGD